MLYPKNKPNHSMSTSKLKMIKSKQSLITLITSKISKQLNKSTDPKANAFIEQEVGHAIQERQLNQNKITEIKRKLSHILNPTSQPTEVSTQREIHPRQSQQNKTQEVFLPSIAKPIQPSWYDVVKFKKEQYEKETELKKKETFEKKRKTLDDLTTQVVSYREKKEKEKQSQMDDYFLNLKEVERLENMELNRKLKKQKKIIEEKAIRDNQLKEAELKKKEARHLKIQNEKKFIKEIENNEKDLENKIIKKKRDEIEHCKKIIEENEARKEQLKKEKEIHKMQDAQALQDYTKYLETNEIKRKNELQAREAKLQLFMNLASEGIVKKEKQQRIEEEKLHLKYINEKERKEAAAEKEGKKKKLIKERQLRSEMAEQIQNKKKQEDEEKEKNTQFLNKWIKESNKIFDKDKERYTQQRKKERETFDYLKTQCSVSQRDIKDTMSQTEKELNKDILKQIYSDETKNEYN